MKFHLIAATALLVGSTAVLAQEAEDNEARDAEATAAAASQAEEDAPSAEELARGEEVVCRRERVTGSRVRVRETCMTRNEWNGVEARTRDGLNRMASGAAGGVACTQDQFGGC